MRHALVVGAGFAGAVTARKLAEAEWNVTVVEQRTHIGGNAYDPILPNKGRVHLYGPHIFHTNSDKVFNFLSRFTSWEPYEHVVRGVNGTNEFPIPANFETIDHFFPMDKEEIKLKLTQQFPDNESVTITNLLTRSDSLQGVGELIFEKIFKDYTEKQWGLTLKELGPTVASRVPIRLNYDGRYFTDKYQMMPRPGYFELFQQMLDHPRISIELESKVLSSDFKHFTKVIYTGSLDELLEYQYGELPYRSLRFEYGKRSHERFQAVAQVNYTDKTPFTRITEFGYLTGEKDSCIAYEYPEAHVHEKNEKFYPIPLQINTDLHKKYLELVKTKYPSVTVVGRLGSYKYFNMDQVIAQALKVSEEIIL